MPDTPGENRPCGRCGHTPEAHYVPLLNSRIGCDMCGCDEYRAGVSEERIRDAVQEARAILRDGPLPESYESPDPRYSVPMTVDLREKEEDRRPVVLRCTRPMQPGEGQALADGIRRVTKYPVIVLDHEWECL